MRQSGIRIYLLNMSHWVSMIDRELEFSQPKQQYLKNCQILYQANLRNLLREIGLLD